MTIVVTSLNEKHDGMYQVRLGCYSYDAYTLLNLMESLSSAYPMQNFKKLVNHRYVRPDNNFELYMIFSPTFRQEGISTVKDIIENNLCVFFLDYFHSCPSEKTRREASTLATVLLKGTDCWELLENVCCTPTQKELDKMVGIPANPFQTILMKAYEDQRMHAYELWKKHAISTNLDDAYVQIKEADKKMMELFRTGVPRL